MIQIDINKTRKLKGCDIVNKYLVIIDYGGYDGITNIGVIYANSKEDVYDEFLKTKGYELDKIATVIVGMDEIDNGWFYFK